ncbi:MAG: hypothetical protein AB1763_00035 [Campylobacterota bacterium]
MRRAVAMIELIFAIVVIAISVLSIPSMMAVANNASMGLMVDEDILKRLSGEIVKVSQARWDQNSLPPDFRPLQVGGDLPCNRPDPFGGSAVFRANPDSSMACATGGAAMAANPAAGNLNLSQGIEQLHARAYNLQIQQTGGAAVYTVPVAYAVSYVDATMSAIDAAGAATATWRLGSSTSMSPAASGTQTHLKRVVARVQNAANPDVDMTLTFFKSNVGKFAE